MLSDLLKWLFRKKPSNIVAADIETAREFVRMSKAKCAEASDVSAAMVRVFAQGAIRAAVVISENEKTTFDQTRAATGFTKEKSDDIARACLRMATGKSVQALQNSADPQENEDALGFRFGCVLFYHLYRLRFVETQVDGEELARVRRAIAIVSGYSHTMLEVGFENLPPSAALVDAT